MTGRAELVQRALHGQKPTAWVASMAGRAESMQEGIVRSLQPREAGRAELCMRVVGSRVNMIGQDCEVRRSCMVRAAWIRRGGVNVLNCLVY